jgi:hypothetical protein
MMHREIVEGEARAATFEGRYRTAGDFSIHSLDAAGNGPKGWLGSWRNSGCAARQRGVRGADGKVKVRDTIVDVFAAIRRCRKASNARE